ncbi:hypothetical protein ACOSQ3_021274 [Xanthoceras sorbifolium]
MEVAERIPEDNFDEVWRYMTDSQVKLIGLYGKGGVGKTTLLTQINNQFLNFPNDIVVIWVTVSKDIQLEKIQETIGKKIGLVDEWNNKLLGEKAVDIYRVLRRRKFVLLLDDIWERVNLVDIPPPNKEIDFKVVFTTRSREVCSCMETHKTVKVEFGEETLNGHPDIPLLAKEVTKECGGLPLTLISIGRAMAGKIQRQEWEFAISILRMFSHEFSGMEKGVYSLLKFSYDCLPSDIYISCFLISKRDLIDCWISEGFLKKYVGISARNFGYNIIEFLLRACLLEEAVDYYDDNVDGVKMHDVIHDMALWIACEIEVQEKFLVRSGAGLTKSPKVGQWENVKRMSLMENKIENLLETLNCPQLLTLFLHWNPLKMVTSEFFQHMSLLQILNLSRTDLIKLLVRILALIDLQHFDLSNTKIIELPEELKALTNLKYLNLEFTSRLRRIPRHVISNLSILQMLRMLKCGIYSSIQSEDSILFDEGEHFLDELVRLENLNVLSIDLKTSRTLRRFLSSYELLKNGLIVESLSLILEDDDCSNSLNILSLGALKELQTLEIRIGGLVELVIDREMRNVPQFHSLHTINLFHCSKLRDATKLRTYERIINVEGEVGEMMMMRNILPFARLEHLRLTYLEELEGIYCNPLSFPHLKAILVRGCPKLKKLPLDSNSMTTTALQIT